MTELHELKDLLFRATPLPWRLDNPDATGREVILGANGEEVIGVSEWLTYGNVVDLAIMVEAVNALPSLLAEIERSRDMK